MGPSRAADFQQEAALGDYQQASNACVVCARRTTPLRRARHSPPRSRHHSQQLERTRTVGATKKIDDIQQIKWRKNCKYHRKSDRYEDVIRGLWRPEFMPNSRDLPFNIAADASEVWERY